eukprot:gene12133-13386_t
MSNNTSSEHIDLLYGCNGEIRSEIPRAESITYGVFLCLQLFLSGLGNVLVCIAIVRFHSLRTLTNSLIFSLAITDLLTPIVRVFFIAITMFREQWIFGCMWCKLSSVLGVFLCASSIMHLCAISIERFIVIKWPLRSHRWVTKQRVAALLATIWIAALLLSLFPYFGFVEMTFNNELLDCEIFWSENPKMSLILGVFFFLLPFIVMSVAYQFIFKEVRKQTRKLTAIQVPPPAPSVDNGRRKSIGARIRAFGIIRRETKAVKVITVVIGIFFVLWLPFFAVTSFRAYYPTQVSGLMQRFAFAMAYFNSSCNWVIYSVMNKDLRRAFGTILKIRSIAIGNSQRRASTDDLAPQRINGGLNRAEMLQHFSKNLRQQNTNSTNSSEVRNAMNELTDFKNICTINENDM